MKKIITLIILFIFFAGVMGLALRQRRSLPPTINFAMQPFSEPKNDTEILTNLVYLYGSPMKGERDRKTLKLGDYAVAVSATPGEKPYLSIKYYKKDMTKDESYEFEYKDFSLNGSVDEFHSAKRTYIIEGEIVIDFFPIIKFWHRGGVREGVYEDPQKDYDGVLKEMVSLAKQKYE
ncbi:MAG TPA: hypothetical protein P5056_01860 [Candidatus Paceibacterota bacterium]|nr:hypothetical protein [Candidatus Paceibacterota bacterium]